MASNVQKTPIARTLNEFAARKVHGVIQQLGKALPAQVVTVMGPIVTVKFLIAATPNSPYTLPNVTMPIVGAEYIRMPTQVGDKGLVFPADTYIGGVSGLGGGVADLSQRANLSALTFFPIGNKNWSTTDDPNKVVIYGPDGAIIRDTGKNSTLTVNQTGITASGKSQVLIEVDGISIEIVGGVINFNGPTNFNGHATGPGGIVNFGSSEIITTGPANVGSLASSGDVQAAGVSLTTHVHGGVQTGGGDTGPPV